MEKNRIPKKGLQARIKGRRGRRRSKTICVENIVEAGSKRGKSIKKMGRLGDRTGRNAYGIR